MAIIKTKINTKSADFSANAEAMEAKVDDLKSTLVTINQGGGAQVAANVTLAAVNYYHENVFKGYLTRAHRSWSCRH